MILSYRDQRTQDFAEAKGVKSGPVKPFRAFARTAWKKLDQLEAAVSVKDLAALRGNYFEKLYGDRDGQLSIRINDQWRICFEWPDGAQGPSNVEITDYH